MKAEITKGCVDVASGDDGPGKGPAEESPHHPERGLRAHVRPAILVADELGRVGKDDGKRPSHSTHTHTHTRTHTHTHTRTHRLVPHDMRQKTIAIDTTVRCKLVGMVIFEV